MTETMDPQNNGLATVPAPSPSSSFPIDKQQLTEVGKQLLADARQAKADKAKELRKTARSLFSSPEEKQAAKDELARLGEREGENNGRKSADPLHAGTAFDREQKEFIVEKFAHFQSVKQVQSAFEERYGRKVDARHLEAYDADNRRCRMGKGLRQLFEQCRKAYIEEGAKVAVAHQAHRLRLIGKLIDKATTAKEFNAAAKLLELAAKETGALVQHVEHKGVVAHVHGTVEEAKAEVAMRLKALIDTAQPTLIDVTPVLPPDAPDTEDTEGAPPA